ncbi:MAG TPA: c-type cytochrome [Gaiellaceae bacterium]|nr:c-type cytochrome [Gaiellaceae bacterium]
MAPQAGGDGLLRWLVGGLVGGAIVLGLLIGAYAVGYHRGHASARPAPAVTTATGTTVTTAAPSGARLFSSEACSGCHSLDGSAGVGPTLKGLAGSRVVLADGTAVTADDAYLTRSITDPDAQIVKGFRAGVMSGAVASLGLNAKPQDVTALIAFLEAQR